MPKGFPNLRLILLFFVFILFAVPVAAQSTAFTYQGKLTDSGNLANGNYDLQFALFDALSGGTQQGTTQTVSNVPVSNGIFTVQLDFGVCASCFNGAARFLEIAVRPTDSGSFTTLSPRQPVTSTPYAINAAQLGGLAASGYLQNSTSQQASSNFNISGNGTAGGTLTGSIVNAVQQVNINGLRAFTVNGAFNDGTFIFTASNTFAGDGAGVNTTPSGTLIDNTGKFNSFYGAGAGQANTIGNFNAFFGAQAGQFNTTGTFNAFFGYQAGFSNTTGTLNAFFGTSAGFSNTTGTFNAFFGFNAGNANTTGTGNAFFGAQAGRFNTTATNNAFFGTQAGQQNTTGDQNAFFGAQAGQFNTTGNRNAFFGNQAGSSNTGVNNAFFGAVAGANNTTGFANVFFGTLAGQSNTTGNQNTLVGELADFTGANTTGNQNTLLGFGTVVTANLSNATAIGANASVTQSNSLILGNNVSVGIGTTAPASKLHVSGTGIIRSRVNSDSNAGVGLALNEQLKWSVATVTGGQFLIFNEANLSNALYIDSATNNVGIGTTSTTDKLFVFGDIRIGTTGTNGCLKSFNGGTITGTCSSDARFKRDITPFPNLLSKIAQLRPVYFYWRSEQFPDRHFGQVQEAGLIAQEVEKVLPELVSEDEQGYKAVNYSKLPLLSIQAIKELKQENDTLKRKLHEQQQQLTQQQQELAALKARQQQEIEELKKLVSTFHPQARRRK